VRRFVFYLPLMYYLADAILRQVELAAYLRVGIHTGCAGADEDGEPLANKRVAAMNEIMVLGHDFVVF